MAIIFDLGAVVFRWQPALLLQTALPQRLSDESAANELAGRFFQSFHVGSDWAEFDRGALEVPELVRRMSARLGLPAEEVQAVLDAIPAHLSLRADTVALVQRLKADGHRLFYLSNMPASLIPQVQPRLTALQLFDDGIYSSDVKLIKPEAAIFRLAQERFELAAADCLFFDDNPHNVSAAQALGWRAWVFSDAATASLQLRGMI